MAQPLDSTQGKAPRAKGSRGPQARGARTRQRILEATLRRIAARGLGALTLRDIAREAGVSLGVVTYHYPARRDLLAAAFGLHLEQTDRAGRAFVTAASQAAGSAPAVTTAELAGRVVALLRRLAHEDRDSLLASHELTLELARDPSLASEVRGAFGLHRDVVAELVAAAGSPMPAIDSEIFAAVFQGLALRWLLEADDPAFESRLRAVAERLVDLFRAPA